MFPINTGNEHTNKKTLQAGVSYILFYTVLFQPVCVLIEQCSFFFCLSPFTATQTSEPQLLCVCVCVVVTWIGAMSPAGNTSSHTIRVQFPLLLFPPIVPVFKCRKNRYPLINSKAVKILSSPKKSHVLVKKC